MDLAAMLKDPMQLAKYAHINAAQTRITGNSHLMRKRGNTLKKVPTVPGDWYLMVMPLELFVPFNPLDLTDEGYGFERTYGFPGTPEMGLAVLKQFARENPEILIRLEQDCKIDTKVINLTSIEPTSEELAAFKVWRKPKVYAGWVQKLKFESDDSEFGMTRHVDVELDDNSEVKSGSFGYDLCRLERTLASLQVKALRASYEEGGENAGRAQSECDLKVKDVYKHIAVGNPYVLGTCRVLYYPTDRNYTFTPEIRKACDKDKNISEFERYITLDSVLKKKYEGYIGGKYDAAFNYLTIKVEVPAKEKADEDLISIIGKISRSAAGSDDRITAQLPDFDSDYAEFRNDLDGWSEEVMLTSVWDYKPIDVETLKSKMKNDLSRYKNVLDSASVADNFMEILQEIDETISSQLIEGSMNGTLSASVVTKDELDAIPQDNADLPGYGGDTKGASIGLEFSQEMLDAMNQIGDADKQAAATIAPKA